MAISVVSVLWLIEMGDQWFFRPDDRSLARRRLLPAPIGYGRKSEERIGSGTQSGTNNNDQENTVNHQISYFFDLPTQHLVFGPLSTQIEERNCLFSIELGKRQFRSIPPENRDLRGDRAETGD